MSKKNQLKYRWRQTRPDREDTLVEYDGANKLGRFYDLRTPEGM